MESPKPFDRRSHDINLQALQKEVREMGDHVYGVMSPELRANTFLTRQMHSRTEEMWEVFEATRNGFRMIATVGNAGVKVVEFGGKIAKPLLWIGALGAAFAAWVKSGAFTLPPWP